MRLNLRKRRMIRRLAAQLVNEVSVGARQAFGREQQYEIGGVPVVLPPAHNLPYYQRRDPTYDKYAEDLVARLAERVGAVHVVDVGANVGDTAVGLLSAHAEVTVTSVEGDPGFLSYLRRNTQGFGPRSKVVEGFVGPLPSLSLEYVRAGSTGGFRPLAEGDAPDAASWVSPLELLPATSDFCVWKSDTDGCDIPILAEHWDVISKRCAVVWFEYDPVGSLGGPGETERLVDHLDGSQRTLFVYDNLGRRVVTLPPGAVGVGMRALTGWLHAQRHGHITVPYLDLWAVDPAVSDVL